MKYLLIIICLLSAGAQARQYQPWTLSWDEPTERQPDPTTGEMAPFDMLTEGGGYNLKVMMPGQPDLVIELDVTETSLDIQSDPNGTDYQIEACDLHGECSGYSNMVKKTANPPAKTILEIK